MGGTAKAVLHKRSVPECVIGAMTKRSSFPVACDKILYRLQIASNSQNNEIYLDRLFSEHPLLSDFALLFTLEELTSYGERE
jgi:hypothetical protein